MSEAMPQKMGSAFTDPIVSKSELPRERESAFTDPVLSKPSSPANPENQDEPEFWDQVMSYGNQAVSAIKDVVAPDNREDLPELHPTMFGEFQYADTPVGMFNIVKKSSWARGRKLRLDQDKYGNPVLVDETEGQRYYFNRPGASRNDINLGKIGLLRIAPAVAAGGPIAATAKSMLAKSGLFGLSEMAGEAAYQWQKAIEGADEGFDYNNVLAAGAYAMGGELAGRMLTPVVSRVWRRLFGKTDDVGKYFDGEKWTDEGIEFLRRAEVDMDTLDDAMQAELRRAGVLTPEQAERYNFMKEQGFNPTKAQITQNRVDYTQQQAAVRSDVGEPVANALVQQNRQMIDKANKIASATGGVPQVQQDTAEQVIDYVTSRALADDATVSAYYKKVRERLPSQKIIKPTNLYNWLKQNAADNDSSGGAIASIWGQLKTRGVIRNIGGRDQLVGRIDAHTAEEIRKKMNELYDISKPYGNIALQKMKSALDDDVFKWLGGKLPFKEAQSAKRRFHSMYTDFRKHKLQRKGENILEQLYNGKIKPHQAMNTILRDKDQLVRLKKFMLNDPSGEGVQVWNNFRGQVIRDAIEDASSSGKPQLGDKLWNHDKFAKKLNSLVRGGKLEILFEPDEITEIGNLIKLGEIRKPITDSAGTTALGYGPSGPAIAKGVEDLLANIVGKTSIAGPAAREVVRKGGDKIRKQYADSALREVAQDAVSPSKRSVDAIKRGMRASREARAARIAGPTGGLAAIGAHQAQGDDETQNIRGR